MFNFLLISAFVILNSALAHSVVIDFNNPPRSYNLVNAMTDSENIQWRVKKYIERKNIICDFENTSREYTAHPYTSRRYPKTLKDGTRTKTLLAFCYESLDDMNSRPGDFFSGSDYGTVGVLYVHFTWIDGKAQELVSLDFDKNPQFYKLED